jgi:hypothetical protein
MSPALDPGDIWPGHPGAITQFFLGEANFQAGSSDGLADGPRRRNGRFRHGTNLDAPTVGNNARWFP